MVIDFVLEWAVERAAHESTKKRLLAALKVLKMHSDTTDHVGEAHTLAWQSAMRETRLILADPENARLLAKEPLTE